MHLEYDNNYYINIESLKEKLNTYNRDVFVFGTGNDSKAVAQALKINNINITKFLDNNLNKQGATFESVEIVAPMEVFKYHKPIVILSNSYFADIFEQLSEMHLEDVYELKDVHLAYAYDKVLIEREKLVEYFIDSKEKRSDKVLVKVFDGFGDNIIKFPILMELQKMPNIDEYYFVVDRQSNYDIYSKLFKHVYLIDKKLFMDDDNYRMDILVRINELFFSYSICFCPTNYYHTHFDPISCLNTNIEKNYAFFESIEWKNGKNKNNILSDMKQMANDIWGWNNDNIYDCKGTLNTIIDNIKLNIDIPDKSISIGMGGISWGHVYSVERISIVIEEFIKKGYVIFLLGYGKSDEEYYYEVCKRLKAFKDKIINLCSKLNAFESLFVIANTRVYVGIDSALVHGAYAFNKNAVVLMSGNNFSRKFVHKDSKMIYLTENLDCIGCNQCIYGKYNQQENRVGECMGLVSPDKIVSAVECLTAFDKIDY